MRRLRALADEVGVADRVQWVGALEHEQLLLYYRALASTPATLATIAEMAYPVAATFIASAPAPYGFNQPLYLPQFVGTGLLIAVIFILNWSKERTPPVIVQQHAAA